MGQNNILFTLEALKSKKRNDLLIGQVTHPKHTYDRVMTDEWLSVFPIVLPIEAAAGTERAVVTLRPITKDDALPFMETVHRNRDIFLDTIPWLANTEGYLVKSYISIWELDQQQRAGLHLVVEVNDRVEGIVNMHTIDWDRSIAHLGYWLASNAQGYGIATKAVSWLSAYALDTLGLDYLDISCREDNDKSRHVAERAGYTLVREIEDYEWVPGEKENTKYEEKKGIQKSH
eukprot:CAMPEP_0184499204 /NCGR_PEP_ID=MMETSP0113_2-20130426/40914_1 /TAXON_ID=91329 /ORGANISM="Norrisiella sphaerica, Strain BC52" /LENGTH=231 /DNA_ID=CAMNT_0026887037 /DNA_START=338 /DNA_END=1034 /DNA_ORIENTATION=-